MAKKSKQPKPGTLEFMRICHKENKPAAHFKQCLSCAKRKADQEHYWKWRIKTRSEQACKDMVCRECGWSMDAHKKELA